MPDPAPSDLPIVESEASPCRHLRNKGMYVYSEPPADDGGDDDDHSIYWCLKTMKNFGPDDDMVGGRDCRNAARSCYEPL
jgi:hypothetical protein